MSAPKGILKKPTAPYVHSAPSKPSKTSTGGSKLKHTLAVAGQSSKKDAREERRSKAKKSRTESDGDDEEEDYDMSGDDEAHGEGEDEDEDDDEPGTDEEIERSRKGKTKATPKRKRPTTADEFGSTLQTLLSESSRPTKSKPSKIKSEASSTVALPSTSESVTKSSIGSSTTTAGPSKSSIISSASTTKSKSTALPILSLSRAKLPPSLAESKLERRAARALKKEKEEKEDRARVRDVVEGWSHPGAGEGGGVVGALEFEKGLRKTAQRGVIKLFNAILTAHKQSAENEIEIRSVKKHKEQPISGVKGYGKKDKDNILGRGSKEELTKEGFLELVKRGTA